MKKESQNGIVMASAIAGALFTGATYVFPWWKVMAAFAVLWFACVASYRKTSSGWE